jgi:beta-ribofuranosylaminobenzene 5'-phosphate synthase
MASAVCVRTPSRLHFGLLDLSARGRRVDGGVGLMLSSPGFEITLRSSPTFRVTPSSFASEVRYCMGQLGVNDPHFEVDIAANYPCHIGLGWRTQLRLGIATAVSVKLGMPIDCAELPLLLDRGGTSGIGSLGFFRGGLIVDGGHLRREKDTINPSSIARASRLAPLLFSSSFPWWVVVAEASGMIHVSGELEKQLFDKYAPLPWAETLETLGAVFSELVPSVVEQDYYGFCGAVVRLRGCGFKAREVAFRDERGAAALRLMEEAGLDGVSMSSWGPAFFGFAESEPAAQSAESRLRDTGFFESVWVTNSSVGGAVAEVDGRCSRVFELATC